MATACTRHESWEFEGQVCQLPSDASRQNNPVLQLQLKQQELAAKIIARETVAR
jgi:hypothetical protein